MSVLVEAISVIIKNEVLIARYPGGIKGYTEDCPNKTICTDGVLTRVGFMAPADVKKFVGKLAVKGFEFQREGTAHDFVVIAQEQGPTTPCDWIEFEKRADGSAHCWLKGFPPGNFHAPPGFVPGSVKFSSPEASGLQVVGHEGNVDILQDPNTGKKFYAGRLGGSEDLANDKNFMINAHKRATDRDGQWKVGDLLDGEWPIQNIFKGGMGSVYIVYESEKSRLVAAKTFLDKAFIGPTGKGIEARFIQEAKAWVNLGAHPNIVQAFEVKKVDNKPFLFLEYVDGGTLGDWIKTDRSSKNIKSIIKFGIELCSGMQFANEHGVLVHRDLKPDNLLLTKDGTLKISDFGLVRALNAETHEDASHGGDSPSGIGGLIRKMINFKPNKIKIEDPRITRVGTILGTLPYMSPEQFIDVSSIDLRSDIYATGIILYEMLSGKLPFQGSSLEEFALLHMRKAPQVITGVDNNLWGIVFKCLEKRPEARYRSFKELLLALSAYYKNRFNESINSSIANSKEDPEKQINYARSLANLGKFDESLKICNTVLAQSPCDLDGWALKSNLHAKLNQNKEAMAAHDKLIELVPESWDAWYRKGLLHNDYKQYGDAESCYLKALQLNNGQAEVWYALGVTYQESNREKEAAVAWDKSLMIDPENYMAWCNRGTVYLGENNVDMAISCLGRAIGLNPKDKLTWANLGYAHYLNKSYKQSLECYKTAFSLGFTSAKEFIDFLEGELNK